MEKLDIQQNTESWLEQRRKIIGGSDIAGIMDISPFTTPLKIWLSKMGRDEPEEDKSFIFEKGHRLEDIARAKLELRLDTDLPPIVVRHKEVEFMQASLDGGNLEEKIQVEIKYQGKDAFNDLKENGTVPPYYMVQVQYQLMITGFEYSYYCAINDENEICFVKVFPDKELMEKVFNAAYNFYHENMIKQVEPGLTAKDSVEIDSIDMKNALIALKNIEKVLSVGKAKKDHIKALISSKMTHCKMHCDEGKITKSVTKTGKESLRITF